VFVGAFFNFERPQGLAQKDVFELRRDYPLLRVRVLLLQARIPIMAPIPAEPAPSLAPLSY